MQITCDPKVGMGYIYLVPPEKHHILGNSSISRKYLPESNLRIPILDGTHLLGDLDRIKIATKTYEEALNDLEFDAEYRNDLNEEGYITGIELTLWKSKFIELIKQEAYKIYRINWRSKDFDLVTFDLEKKVISSNNVIYSLTENQDVYVILDIEPKYKIAHVKGLLSSREDIYPVTYLAEPNFILWEYGGNG